MTAADVESYKQAMGKLFGGHYSYRKALSRQGVQEMTESETLPPGEWAIIAQRPQMELKACVEALRFAANLLSLRAFREICIYTDSRYVVGNYKMADPKNTPFLHEISDVSASTRL